MLRDAGNYCCQQAQGSGPFPGHKVCRALGGPPTSPPALQAKSLPVAAQLEGCLLCLPKLHPQEGPASLPRELLLQPSGDPPSLPPSLGFHLLAAFLQQNCQLAHWASPADFLRLWCEQSARGQGKLAAAPPSCVHRAPGLNVTPMLATRCVCGCGVDTANWVDWSG